MTNVGAPLGPAPQGHGGRRHTRFAKLRRLLHRKPDPVDIETALTANTVIHLTTTFGECSLFVRVFGATGLFAADSNGFSDPYVVLKLGHHRATSKVEWKTLDPHWNETFVFKPEDVVDAIDDGMPRISFRVYDRDLLSSDDFLGQAALELSQLDPVTGSSGRITLPLSGLGDHGAAAHHARGRLHVSMWFHTVQAEGDEIHAAKLTLMPQPGAIEAPKLLHYKGSCLYEEPLFACVGVKVQDVLGLLGVSSSPDRDAGPSEPLHPPLRKRLLGSDVASDDDEGPTEGPSPWRKLRHHRADEAAAREDMQVGQRSPWGEEEGNDMFDYQQPSSYEAAEDELDAPDEHEGMGSGLSDMGDDDTSSSIVTTPAQPHAGSTGAHTGKFLYCRLVLGMQSVTSKAVRERAHGPQRAVFGQQLVFAVPVPLQDRILRMEVYRTSSVTSKGRPIAAAQLPLLDILPFDAPGKLSLSLRKDVEVALSLLPSGGGDSSMRLSVSLADADRRRVLYGQPLLSSPPGLLLTRSNTIDHLALPGMDRLQSETPLLNARGLRRMARMTESEVASADERRQRLMERWQAFVALPLRAVSEASELAGEALQRLVEVASLGRNVAMRVIRGDRALPEVPEDAAASGSSAAAGAAAGGGPLPEPLARLRIGLSRVTLPRHLYGSSNQWLFCVFKCGPCWIRMPLQSLGSDDVAEWGWEGVVPVFDPGELLLLAVFEMRHRVATRRAALLSGYPLLVGKLRVRLSTLDPGRQITATLPVLADRRRSGRRVGSAILSLQLDFVSPAARLKAYFRPLLPDESYVHGLDTPGLQRVFAFERRRMLFRWLRAATPAIEPEVARAVLDTEREEFFRSRLSANTRRVQDGYNLTLKVTQRFIKRVQTWESTPLSLAACALCVAIVYLPRLVISALLAWAAVACWRSRPTEERQVFSMEEDPSEAKAAEEAEGRELDAYTGLTRRYLHLRRITLRLQNVLDDVAKFVERVVALFTWQDPLATTIAMAGLALGSVMVLVLGVRFVTAFAMLFVLRPPRLRTPTPPPPKSLFVRLPSHADRIA